MLPKATQTQTPANRHVSKSLRGTAGWSSSRTSQSSSQRDPLRPLQFLWRARACRTSLHLRHILKRRNKHLRRRRATRLDPKPIRHQERLQSPLPQPSQGSRRAWSFPGPLCLLRLGCSVLSALAAGVNLDRGTFALVSCLGLELHNTLLIPHAAWTFKWCLYLVIFRLMSCCAAQHGKPTLPKALTSLCGLVFACKDAPEASVPLCSVCAQLGLVFGKIDGAATHVFVLPPFLPVDLVKGT